MGLTAAASSSRSKRALSVTWPRVTPRLRASRTSPSQRANTPGSFMEGLKKRWFTERTSMLTRPPPTGPSAAPNPVMLRIISSGVSYGRTTTLSIPKLPSHAVELELPRHVESRYLRIGFLQQIAKLVRDHRRLDPNLDLEIDRAKSLRHAHAIGVHEAGVRAVFMRQRRQEPKVAARKFVQQVGLDEQLAPRLVLGTIQPGRIVPGNRPSIHVHSAPEPAAQRNRARGGALFSHDRALAYVLGAERRRREQCGRPTLDD